MVTAERISDEQAISGYLQYFDLTEGPFVGPDDYFYAGADRRNTLDQLVHYCRFSEQLVVLTAELGNGKTTLVDATISQLNTVIDCCRIPATDISGPESVVASLGRALHLSMQSLSVKDFLDTLKQRTVVDEEPEPILVIIEAAEGLPMPQLESLVRLHDLARSYLHLMLVGTLPLKRRIEKIAADNPNIKLFALRPLSLPEIESYVLSRLQSAGYSGAQPFSHDQLVVLHEQSGGIIAEINRMIPVLLEDSQQHKTVARKRLLPFGHMLALGILFAAVLASIFFEFGVGGATTDSGQEVKRAVMELPVTLPSRPIERSVPEQLPRFSERTAAVNVNPQAPLPAKSSEKSVTVLPPAIVPPTPSAVKTQSVKVSEKVTPQSKSETTGKPQQISAPAEAPLVLSTSEKKILGMKASSYMLQILGSSNQKNVQDYVKRYTGRMPISYIETSINQKPWYVVLVGPYATKELAQQEFKRLPAEVQKQSPWVRSVGSIQTEIKSRSKP